MNNMKIIVYTITTSEFCDNIKKYLTSKNLPFEEKNVETNKDFLSEMLTASDNFAGVPFTWFQFDDGSEAGLKGFTESEFDDLLMHHQLINATPTTNEPPVSVPMEDTPTGIVQDETPTPLPKETPSLTQESVYGDDNDDEENDEQATTEPLNIDYVKTQEVDASPVTGVNNDDDVYSSQGTDTSTPIPQQDVNQPEPQQTPSQTGYSQQSAQISDVLQNLKQQGIDTSRGSDVAQTAVEDTQTPIVDNTAVDQVSRSNPLDGSDTTDALKNIRQKMTDLQSNQAKPVENTSDNQTSDTTKMPDFPK